MEDFRRKEKYNLANTLNCIPILLQGHAVLIDLRNETSVAGRIDNADGFMNINLVDAVFIDRDGMHYPFEQFMIRERMIRHIHLPPTFDVVQEVRDLVEHGLHREKRKPIKSGKRTFKKMRAEKKHKETLAEVEKQKMEKQKAKSTRSIDLQNEMQNETKLKINKNQNE